MTAPTGTSLCDTKVTRLVPIGQVYLAEILYADLCEIWLIVKIYLYAKFRASRLKIE